MFGVPLIWPVIALAQTAQPTPEIEPIHATITVSEKIQNEAPAAITVLGTPEIRRIPGVNLDDRLRSIPGFTLLRRSSSLVANPTTQGVSLRAVGSNGASRTLVLWDSVPLNDPFGSWIYWTRVPPQEIEDVEIVRGATSSVFGDRAMGGAISIFSRTPEQLHALLSYDGGNRGTGEVAGSVSNVWRHAAGYAQVRAFTTDGYYIVPNSVRGPVDTPANVRFVAGSTRWDFLGTDQRLAIKLDVLAEERANGTVLQRNSTSVGTLSANYSRQFGSTAISALAYHTREEFRASFSAIGANRATEQLTYNQSVPSESTGGAAYASRRWSSGSLIGGGDFERVEGYSTDHLFPSGIRIGGGSRVRRAGFAQANLKTGALNWYAGARENWTGGGDTFFSPNGGVVAGLGRIRLRGSVYRAFRAPTLNELYRQFRVGNAVTQANAALQPETMFGAEAGFDIVGEGQRLSVTAFRNELDGLITNVTLQSGPAGITRQRRNAAAALARGVEANYRVGWRHWNAEASYLFADSRVVTGLRVPQIPKHQGNARASWVRGGTVLSAGVLSYAKQFEDDINQFLLPGFATLQLYARQYVGAGVSLAASVENLLDRQYLAGFTPTPMIGAPRLWRVGIRWETR